MENVKQLLTSYLELMEKGESAAGWKESVRYFHSAAELADKTLSSGCRDQLGQWLLS